MTQNFKFELKYVLPLSTYDGDDLRTEHNLEIAFALSNAVYEAGYHDAIIGTGNSRLLAVDLELTGENAEIVILTAARNILKKLPKGSRLHEVCPDLVNLAEVAEHLEVKRQALQQRQMPPPVASGLYRITEIAETIAEIAQPKPNGRRARMNFAHAEGWFSAGKVAATLNAKMALNQLDTISLEEK